MYVNTKYGRIWIEALGFITHAIAVDTATAQCWSSSYDLAGNCTGIDLRGTTDDYSNQDAFIALNKAAGTAQCWCEPANGGNCEGIDFRGITDVYSTIKAVWTSTIAFIVLNKFAGTAQCWGHPDSGGNCTGIDFSSTTDVYSTAGAFIALSKAAGTACIVI